MLGLLLFKSENCYYAIHLSCVIEILKTPTISELPRQKMPTLGVSFVRDVIVVNLSLEALLQTKCSQPRKEFILILSARKNQTAESIGLHVDTVLGIHHLDNNDIQAPPEGSHPSVEGVFFRDNTSFCLLSPARLLRPLDSELITF